MTNNIPTAKDWLILGVITSVAGEVAKAGVNYSLGKRASTLGSLLLIDEPVRVKPRQVAVTLAVCLVAGSLQGILFGRYASRMMEHGEEAETKTSHKKGGALSKVRLKKQAADIPQYDPSYIQ
jgi:hypothetical protein